MVLLSPMVVSKVILGAAVLSLMATFEVPRSWAPLVMMHMLVTLPFAFLVLWTRLSTLGRTYEEAAASLGSDEITTTWEITLPLVMPAILGGLLLCFTVSFDEFSATQFLARPSTATVPVRVYSMIETAITPTINVLATFLIIVRAPCRSSRSMASGSCGGGGWASRGRQGPDRRVSLSGQTAGANVKEAG